MRTGKQKEKIGKKILCYLFIAAESALIFWSVFCVQRLETIADVHKTIQRERIVTEQEKYEERELFPKTLSKDGEVYILSKIEEKPIQEDILWMIRHSEPVRTEEELPRALPFYWNAEEHRMYSLYETKISSVQVDGGTRQISKEESFLGLQEENEIPRWIEVSSGQGENNEEKVTLSLAHVIEDREYWKEDLEISVVFREYEAPFYMFEGHKVPHDDAKPRLEGMEEAILRNQGLAADTHRITGMRWGGGTWLDEQYGKCREALITGERLVKDYTAVYTGEENVGMISGYQLEMTYTYQKKRDKDSKVHLTALYIKENVESYRAEDEEDGKKEIQIQDGESHILWQQEEVVGTVVLLFLICFLGWLFYVVILGRSDK